MKEICFAKAQPKYDSFILFVIKPKEKVTAIEEYNDWLKIQKPNDPKISGWVNRNKLEIYYKETKLDSFLVNHVRDLTQNPKEVRTYNLLTPYIFYISFIVIVIIIFLIVQIAKNNNKQIKKEEQPKTKLVEPLTKRKQITKIDNKHEKITADVDIKKQSEIEKIFEVGKYDNKSDPIEQFLEAKVKYLPSYLEDFLFDELDAVYNQLKKEYEDPRNEKELKGYLGTYFPRSFIETKTIFLELFKSRTIKKIFSDKKEFNILDVGSGSGGNLIGFLDCLREHDLMYKQINIISVDGFKLALDYQEKIIIEYFLREINSKMKLSFKQECHRFQDMEDFKNTLDSILKEKEIKYDIVMTSKFISSLYTIKNGTWDGTYKFFAQLAQDFLEKDGIALFFETTNPPKNQTRFMSAIMNSELARLLAPEFSLKQILPLSCAFYYKNCKLPCFTQKIYKLNHNGFKKYKLIHIESKNDDLTHITFKVFVHHELANKVLVEIKQRNKYIQNWKNDKNDRNQKIYPDSICQEGVSLNMNDQAPNTADAFSLN